MSKTISGIVTWLKQWFYTKDEIDTQLPDSGWQSLTFSSGYTNYNTTEPLQIRKIGKFVEIRGIIKPTAQKSASTNAVQFATIPTGYRPSYQFRSAICQGSGMIKWHLTAETDGKLCWSRYGSASSVAVPSGAWLCVHITYMIDG